MVLEQITSSDQSRKQLINLKYILKKHQEAGSVATKIKIDQGFFTDSEASEFIISGASKDNVTEILQSNRVDRIQKIYIATNDQTVYNEVLPIYNGWQWDKTKTHLENLLWLGRLNDNDYGIAFWNTISVKENNNPASNWFEDNSFGSLFTLIYSNRAKTQLLHSNPSLGVVMWEKNNAIELPVDTNGMEIDAYISFPWEWSASLTDWNSSSNDKEMREGIPVALYTLELAKHPSVFNEAEYYSPVLDTEIEDLSHVYWKCDFLDWTREDGWTWKEMVSTKWKIKLSYPYGCIDTGTISSVNNLSLSWLATKGLTIIDITPQYIELELDRLKIGKYKDDQAALQIQATFAVIATWIINDWDNIDVYETTHNWVSLPSNNKIDMNSNLIAGKTYVVQAKDKKGYVVKSMEIIRNSNGKVVVSSLLWYCEFTPSQGVSDSYTVNVNYEKFVVKNITNTSKAQKLPDNAVTYKWDTPLKIQEISKADYDKLTSVSPGVLYITKDGGGE